MPLTPDRRQPRPHGLLTLLAAAVLVGSAPSPAAAASDGTEAVATPALSERALRTDRTRVGKAPEPTLVGLSQLVPPADVVGGRTLEEKPPPWHSPVGGAELTARFGATGLWASTHTGLDFAAPEGTPLVAVGPGVVESAAYDGAFGNKVVLRLQDGTRLWYCHLSSTAVSPGDVLEAGSPVGALGSTGNVTGPHLHLEVHPPGSGPTDPEAWLAERGLL